MLSTVLHGITNPWAGFVFSLRCKEEAWVRVSEWVWKEFPKVHPPGGCYSSLFAPSPHSLEPYWELGWFGLSLMKFLLCGLSRQSLAHVCILSAIVSFGSSLYFWKWGLQAASFIKISCWIIFFLLKKTKQTSSISCFSENSKILALAVVRWLPERAVLWSCPSVAKKSCVFFGALKA